MKKNNQKHNTSSSLQKSKIKGLLRLTKLKEENELRQEQANELRPRFQELKQSEGVKVITAFNLFQTPHAIVDRMIDLADTHTNVLNDKSIVLEPSAGLGRIYDGIRRRSDAQTTLVENNRDCCGHLYNATKNDPHATLLQRDFLEVTDETLKVKFDFIIMNPPFKQGRDIKHIKHALTFLKPGGKLIALCFDGVRQNKHLKPICDTWEVLPPNSFSQEGTKASVALLTIELRD